MRTNEWHDLKEGVIVAAGKRGAPPRFRLEMRDHLGRWIASPIDPVPGPPGLVTLASAPGLWRIVARPIRAAD